MIHWETLPAIRRLRIWWNHMCVHFLTTKKYKSVRIWSTYKFKVSNFTFSHYSSDQLNVYFIYQLINYSYQTFPDYNISIYQCWVPLFELPGHKSPLFSYCINSLDTNYTCKYLQEAFNNYMNILEPFK